MPLSLAEMISVPGGVEAPPGGNFYELHDICSIELRELSTSPENLAGFLALRLVFAKTVEPEHLDQITGE